MTREAQIHVSPDELAQIVESVFAAQLDTEVMRCDAPWFPEGDGLTAVVQLSGSWNGTVVLECSRRQACQFTGNFIGVALQEGPIPPAEVDEVVRDTMGELVNMIGGNLKCVLAPGIELSMPSVRGGCNFAPGMEVRERLAFQSAEGTFWITVLVAASDKGE
ncbi:MAG TPA: chemotaxis protein CheX [Bryobacteraceae bacterium]